MPGIQKTTLLISAQPGLWRNALESYLKAKPELEIHAIGQDLGELFTSLQDRRYDMLLMETVLNKDALRKVMARLQTEQAGLVSIIVCDTPDQYQTVESAGSCYAAMRLMLQTRFEEILDSSRSKGRESATHSKQ